METGTEIMNEGHQAATASPWGTSSSKACWEDAQDPAVQGEETPLIVCHQIKKSFHLYIEEVDLFPAGAVQCFQTRLLITGLCVVCLLYNVCSH